jgi:hypothetical protein
MLRATAVLIPVILAVVTAWPGRTGDWIRDDLTYVVDNPQVVLDRPVFEAFTTPFAPDASEKLGLWRPLTTVSFMIDHRRAGEESDGFPYDSAPLRRRRCGVALRSPFGVGDDSFGSRRPPRRSMPCIPRAPKRCPGSADGPNSS